MNDYKIDINNPIKFTMLVGLPGSGKSTLAKEIINNSHTSIVIMSSDEIRFRLFGDESSQENNNKVFEVMHNETLNHLNNGISVIYDATNVTRKSRESILSKIPKFVYKECIICWAPYDICCDRDANRVRTVGPKVIEKMMRRFQAPFYDEGFNSITVHIDDQIYNKEEYYNKIIEDIKIPHDNPNHSKDVIDHCNYCKHLLIEANAPDFLIKAGMLHDIGKPFTKTFRNTKGEVTDVAHYYDHQAVGSYMSYGIGNHNIVIAWLISSHMAPFINEKYYKSLPPIYKEWIDELHNADSNAH